MYKFIKIRHDILIQCHGNYMEMKIFNHMLEIDILRNSSQSFLGVLEGCFLRVWVSKKTPRRLLAKTMMSCFKGNLSFQHWLNNLC